MLHNDVSENTHVVRTAEEIQTLEDGVGNEDVEIRRGHWGGGGVGVAVKMGDRIPRGANRG